MTRKTYRIRRITVAIALAASGPVLAAQPAPAFDARSPDAREAAEQTRAGSVVDLRSPDAREAAEQANVGSRITVDLRSPDAREAADQGDPSRGISVVDARSPDASDAAAAIGVDNSAATLTILVGTPLLGLAFTGWDASRVGFALVAALIAAAAAAARGARTLLA